MVKARSNIYLIGLPGSGKTTVGKMLARFTERDFYDSDQIIVNKTGVTIKTIFDLEGEAGFRTREKKVITELTRKKNIILATGGGAILAEENRKLLAVTGLVIYLAADPEFIKHRIQKDTVRPLLQDPDPGARLKRLYQTRNPLYLGVADIVFPINANSGSVYHTAAQIQLLLKNDSCPLLTN